MRKSDFPVTEDGRQCQDWGSFPSWVDKSPAFPSVLRHVVSVTLRHAQSSKSCGFTLRERPPLCTSLFLRQEINRPWKPQQTFPLGSLVRSRSRASPTLITTKETGMTMTGLHLSGTIPDTRGQGL